MFRCLCPGAIGISASLDEGLSLAQSAGFQGLEISIDEVAARAQSTSIAAVKDLFEHSGIRPGGWGLPINWRAEGDAFKAELERLDRLAGVAEELGCFRTSTWILSFSDSLAFEENFAWHQAQLAPIVSLLASHGCSLGLEFLGPKTIRRNHKHEFVWNIQGMMELCKAVHPTNAGLLLDCWHWHTSGGTLDEIGSLTGPQVVYVHVNDAPADVPLDEQIDNVRGLPGETGVIDIKGFLKALQRIGYDGPITPEPFVKRLNEMAAPDAARLVGQSMQRIWALAGLP
jgi:sugar phosphate isomerase/epimerase